MNDAKDSILHHDESAFSAYLADTERQLGLWGAEGQLRLARSTVVVGGLGGIGAISALMLAKAGIGRICVCDRDFYEVANIVEQAFASYETLGRSKVEVSLQEMGRHSRFAKLEGFVGDLSEQANCERLVAGADIVVSGVDNAAARIALGRCAEAHGIPFVVAANIGWTVVHTVYLPGAFNYGAFWQDVPGVRTIDGFPDMADPMTAAAVNKEWDIWVAAVSSFLPESLEQFLITGQSYYWYASPPAYFAASIGIMDTLKLLTGHGTPLIYPNLFLYDMQHNRAWDWNELRRRRNALRKVWERGPDVVCKIVAKWNPPEFAA